VHLFGCNKIIYLTILSPLDTPARQWPLHSLVKHAMKFRSKINIWQERYILPPQLGFAALHWSWGYWCLNTGGSVTAWSRAVVEKMCFPMPVKKISRFYWTRIFISVLTNVCLRILSFATWTRTINSHHISWKFHFINILPCTPTQPKQSLQLRNTD
jgi:hypothetical protein